MRLYFVKRIQLTVAQWRNMALGIFIGIDPGNGLASIRCHTITWTNSDLQSVRSLGTHFNEILIEIQVLQLQQQFDTAVRTFFKMVTIFVRPRCSHSFRPGDATRCHRSESTLAQTTASCLTMPSHCLNYCWLIVIRGSVAFTWEHFTRRVPELHPLRVFRYYSLKLLPHFSGAIYASVNRVSNQHCFR